MLLTAAGRRVCASKKGGANCSSSQLHGLIVNCAQGQVWEAQSESPLILTSIGIPAPDVKKTNRDPSVVKLIWASNLLTRWIIGVTSQKTLCSSESRIWHGTDRTCQYHAEQARVRIMHIRESGCAAQLCTRPFLGHWLLVLSFHSSLRSSFGRARSSALWGCRSDTTWLKGCK